LPAGFIGKRGLILQGCSQSAIIKPFPVRKTQLGVCSFPLIPVDLRLPICIKRCYLHKKARFPIAENGLFHMSAAYLTFIISDFVGYLIDFR